MKCVVCREPTMSFCAFHYCQKPICKDECVRYHHDERHAQPQMDWLVQLQNNGEPRNLGGHVTEM